MKNLLKAFAIFAVTALLATTSFAGNSTSPVDCARQYRNCLNTCNQQEATAKKNKATCEAAAKTQYPNGGTAYNQAIAACRTTYNSAMQSIAGCRAACQRAFVSCNGGGYEG